MIYLRGDGRVSYRRCLHGLDRGSWPDLVHDADGRSARLLTPAVAAWRRQVLISMDDLAREGVAAYELERSTYLERSERIRVSRASADTLRPYVDWLRREGPRLDGEARRHELSRRRLDEQAADFFAAVERAEACFWSPQERAEYHSGRVAAAAPVLPGVTPGEFTPFVGGAEPLGSMVADAARGALRHFTNPRAAGDMARALSREYGGAATDLGRHWLAVAGRLSPEQEIGS